MARRRRSTSPIENEARRTSARGQRAMRRGVNEAEDIVRRAGRKMNVTGRTTKRSAQNAMRGNRRRVGRKT